MTQLQQTLVVAAIRAARTAARDARRMERRGSCFAAQARRLQRANMDEARRIKSRYA